MKDDLELQMNDNPPDGRIHSPKRRRIESDSNKLLSTMIVVLLALIVAGGVYYFITRRPPESDVTLQSKFASLEEKIAGLEKQIMDLKGRSMTGSPDPSLLHQVETLSQKVEALEKRTEPKTVLKAIPSPSKPPATAQKRYHTVKKGETLFKISKQYGITMEELRNLNGLSRNQPIRTGQKLLVSSGG